MAKVGFNGQWVEIAKVGTFADSSGVDRVLTPDWYRDVIANYSAGPHEAPAVLGHPDSDSAPAYGWVRELRLNGDSVEARFADTNDEFEKAIERGEYKKKSASFYLNPPNLRHVAFLGAQPPAIKGLRDIQFAEGESFAVESIINFKETEMGLEDKDVEKVTDGVFQKLTNFFGKKPADGDAPAANANFSEADVKKLIADAAAEIETKVTEKVTAEFTEKVTKLETRNADLEKRIDGGDAAGVRREIASFVESFPAEKGKHFLKNIGIADFLERLAVDDAADANSAKAISFSEGEGDDKQTHEFSRYGFAKDLLNSLPPFIQFGEKFGPIDASKAIDNPLVNSDRVASMKEAAGVADDKGGK